MWHVADPAPSLALGAPEAQQPPESKMKSFINFRKVLFFAQFSQTEHAVDTSASLSLCVSATNIHQSAASLLLFL